MWLLPYIADVAAVVIILLLLYMATAIIRLLYYIIQHKNAVLLMEYLHGYYCFNSHLFLWQLL